ncbi:phosphatase PAP2 family protein [Alkalihalobacillus deserti]|uniref:phosphatase PAP2 family protein n=1 Tax=Alkalihalobacillus deserti TaxID=2879466 RepID=UPI001D14C1E9|nr:phosphatase PAP2 family protein [Alkalihalobacillus deserti]
MFVINRFVNWLTVCDNRMFLIVNKQWRCRLFDFSLPKITHLGGAPFCLTLLFLLMILFSNSLRYSAFVALLSIVASQVTVQLIKKFSCRKRPYIILPDVYTCSNPLKDYSFPSGHTTAAFSIAIVFAYYYPWLLPTLLPLAILVGLSRMYLGLHYPTDCIIGALIGSISSLVAILIFSH